MVERKTRIEKKPLADNKIVWSERMRLTEDESLRRTKDFDKRKDQFIATFRGERNGRMIITIDISTEAGERLRKRANRTGLDLNTFVQNMVEISAEPLAVAAAPIHEEFRKSGMTQEELDELTDELIREVRAEKPLHLR